MKKKLQLVTFLVSLLMFVDAVSQVPEVLRVALVPAEDSRAMIRQSEHLLAELEEKLGIKVEGFVAGDYNGVIESLRAGHVDVAYMGPFSYVKAAQVAEVEPFAVAETENGLAYHSQIVVRADSDIKNIEQLRGKNFAFVAPTSTSGYVYPMVGMKEAGIDIRKDLKNVVYSGGHDGSLLAVKHGQVHAAAVADRILDLAVQNGKIQPGELRIIWRSEAIPESPMVWRKDLPEQFKARIRDVFFSIRDIPFGDQGRISGYRATDHQAYDIVRKAEALARQ
ncbi:phosphate/phosphite/phosphonate ABC transporter substrate-binding protein [Microbulbifer sp.]|uniref:phosphate/phosphite/phosphonate ABC transporter substrate-binding protein n=1 Tax=Microbulbifer sp. TaxID=1908541 RepID=UPI002F95B021